MISGYNLANCSFHHFGPDWNGLTMIECIAIKKMGDRVWCTDEIVCFLTQVLSYNCNMYIEIVVQLGFYVVAPSSVIIPKGFSRHNAI